MVALGAAGCSSGLDGSEKTASSSYELLEPSNWIGKELPILEHVDIAETLKKGTWLVLFYHYDCPDCDTAIPKYEQIACDMAGNEDFLRIALIAVPPYGRCPVSGNSPCALGRLTESKKWFVTTPAVTLLTDGLVKSAWEEKAPDLDTILKYIVKIQATKKYSLFSSIIHFINLPYPKGGEHCDRTAGRLVNPGKGKSNL